jgi:DNA modification methylase
LEVKEISTDKLIPYIRNPRNNKGAVAKVAASIKEFGFRQPIVVDSEMVVVAGHTRLAAAWRLGLGKVPVHIAKNLSDAQIQAYRIMDNRSHEDAEWDNELLAIELGDLLESDFDLDLTGFSQDEIDQLLNDKSLTGELEGEDDAPELPAEPTSKRGEIYQLGEHRLMCGDATNENDVSLLMEGHEVDLVFTDPPYGMNYSGGREKGNHSLDKRGVVLVKAWGNMKGDDLEGEELLEIISSSLKNINSYKKDGGGAYICSTWRTYSQFEASINKAGFDIRACIVWDKKSIGLGKANYRPQHEFIFYCGGQWYGGKAESDVWQMTRGATAQYVHPTQKPVELIEKALANSSKAGDNVADLFGGSGSTLIASEKLNRKCYMMELDPAYCDVIIERYEKLFEKKAEKTN